MPIKEVLGGIALAVLLVGCQKQSASDLEDDWRLYKSKFVAEDGRIIDTGNGNVSHSEGQGYGMILAVKLNDKDTFGQVWHWTLDNLQVRNDSLFMWRRRPDTALPDEDRNNASDGDILIAWALLEAAEKWQEPAYEQAAFKILNDIKSKLIVRNHGMPILLPGEYGFKSQDKVILNLSYWVYPALSTFSLRDSDPVWTALIASGRALLRQARFGRWQLPPDWLTIDDADTISPAKSGRFGYDAVRIPLYLDFAGFEDDFLEPFAECWSFYQGYTPAWIALEENVMDSYGAGSGIRAIKQVILSAVKKTRSAQFESLDMAQDYYSATLLLLSKLSYIQSRQR
ncbi:MAG: glycosyl hydrolase family 8 [Gammaproteobacteria bacterium]